MAPAPNYVPTRLYNLFPHPAQDANEKKRYVVMLTSRYVVPLDLLSRGLLMYLSAGTLTYRAPSFVTCTQRVGVHSTVSWQSYHQVVQ